MKKLNHNIQDQPISNIKKFFQKALVSEYFVLYLTIIFFFIFVPFVPGLFSLRNFNNILSNIWPLLVIAIGQTFVLISAGIDLSQTSIMALASVIGAMIMTTAVDPMLFEKSPLWGVVIGPDGGLLAGSFFAVPIAILIMLSIGATMGIINGFSIAHFKMPPFMVTLVAMIFYSALAIYIPKSENIMNLPASFIAISKGTLFNIIPISALLVILLAIIAHIILSKTLYGRWLYAIGINTRVSKVSGIPTKTVTVIAYMISGIFAAVGSILYSGRLEAGRPTLGSELLLDIIGANIIGGISLFGGKGKVKLTFFGVLFFIILRNTLSMLNLNAFIIDIVRGGVILLAVLIDVARSGILARKA